MIALFLMIRSVFGHAKYGEKLGGPRTDFEGNQWPPQLGKKDRSWDSTFAFSLKPLIFQFLSIAS